MVMTALGGEPYLYARCMIVDVCSQCFLGQVPNAVPEGLHRAIMSIDDGEKPAFSGEHNSLDLADMSTQPSLITRKQNTINRKYYPQNYSTVRHDFGVA